MEEDPPDDGKERPHNSCATHLGSKPGFEARGQNIPGRSPSQRKVEKSPKKRVKLPMQSLRWVNDEYKKTKQKKKLDNLFFKGREN